MRRILGCAALVGLLWLTWPAVGQQNKSGQPLTDQTFVKKVSADNLAEIDLGRLALKHAASEEVKTFARRMIDDHTKANKDLNRLADSKRITPAPEADKKHRELMEKLSALHGAEFDREFMHHMVNDHKEAVALFERESKEGQDPQIREFASKTLPTLREHLKLARKIAGIEERDGGKQKNP